MTNNEMIKMENHNDIIDIIKKQEAISPPDDIVQKVMEGAKKAGDSFDYKLYRLLFQRRELSSDAKNILAGKVVSSAQCAFLLFAVGLFYLLSGLFVLLGMKDILAYSHVNILLKAQPYIAIISAGMIILLAIMVWKKPQTIIFAKYAIVVHTAFIVINAVAIQFMLFSAQAILFSIILIAVAIIFGVLLISTIRGFMKGNILTSENNFV